MNNVHGIVYAYHGFSQLRELGTHRTGASLPFCGRYRLIDFALSSMMNAGIHDVGVIMQRGYQSLMDHLGSGRAWDMSRRTGGMRLLPPYGLPDSHKGIYGGCMEALAAVYSYLKDIKQEYVVLERGDLCANIDLGAAVKQHISGGSDVTAVCARVPRDDIYHCFVPDASGSAGQILCRHHGEPEGPVSLEVYILKRDLLLELVEWCAERGKLHFHRDALSHLLAEGGKIGIYMHEGYARHITGVAEYYEANMDMLCEELRHQLFTDERRVTTRERSDVSTYYGDAAKVTNSLVADGCVIEGEVESCVVFCGARIEAGSSLRDCIIMNDTVIKSGASLKSIISDKHVVVSPHVTLSGSKKLPLVIPKDSVI